MAPPPKIQTHFVFEALIEDERPLERRRPRPVLLRRRRLLVSVPFASTLPGDVLDVGFRHFRRLAVRRCRR